MFAQGELNSCLTEVEKLLPLIRNLRESLAQAEQELNCRQHELRAAATIATLSKEVDATGSAGGRATRAETMSLGEVAALLRVSRQTVYVMRRDGRLPAPIGISCRKSLYLRSDVEAWLTDKHAK